MFIVNYSQLVDNNFYSDYIIYYMTGLKVINMTSTKALVNVDTKTAFVYSE